MHARPYTAANIASSHQYPNMHACLRTQGPSKEGQGDSCLNWLPCASSGADSSAVGGRASVCVCVCMFGCMRYCLCVLKCFSEQWMCQRRNETHFLQVGSPNIDLHYLTALLDIQSSIDPTPRLPITCPLNKHTDLHEQPPYFLPC